MHTLLARSRALAFTLGVSLITPTIAGERDAPGPATAEYGPRSLSMDPDFGPMWTFFVLIQQPQSSQSQTFAFPSLARCQEARAVVIDVTTRTVRRPLTVIVGDCR